MLLSLDDDLSSHIQDLVIDDMMCPPLFWEGHQDRQVIRSDLAKKKQPTNDRQK
jgi:hypothetical protein